MSIDESGYFAEQRQAWAEIDERIGIAEKFLPGLEDKPHLSVEVSAITAAAHSLVAIAKALRAWPD